MRGLLNYAVAAALAISGATYVMTYADSNPPNVNAANNMATPIANNADTHTVRQIQRTLGRVISDMSTKGDLDDVISYLSKETRDRIGKLKDDQFKDLDARVDEFQNNWHQKYNEYFGMSYYRDILNNIAVETDGKDRVNVMVSDQPFAGVAVFDTGNAAGTAAIVPGHTHSVSLAMVNQGSLMNEWRIDSQLQSADQLKQQLIDAFDHLNRDKDSWPADKTEAYRTVSVRLLRGITGEDENAAPTANVR